MSDSRIGSTAGLDQRVHSFSYKGMRCAAALHLPDGASDNSSFPAVLMIHGWGGEQEVLLEPFIEKFKQAGFAVFTFDYPRTGNSEGEPRNVINPVVREKVAEQALVYLGLLPMIDPSKIVLWGTSFGGGHTLRLAARHPELKGAIAHVPLLNGFKVLIAQPFVKCLRLSLDVAIDLLSPFGPRYIPTIGNEHEYATMTEDGAIRFLECSRSKLDDYNNRVAARSLIGAALYQPLSSLSAVKIPLLIVGGRQDTVTPFYEQQVRNLAGANVEIEALDANHFDPYFEPVLSRNIDIQIAFLERLITH